MSQADEDRGATAMPAESRTTDGTPAGVDLTRDAAPTGGAEAPERAEAPEPSGVERAPAWVRLWWTPLVLFAVVGLLAAGAGLRALIDRPPADGSVDVGFARDMSEHHAQAVQMSMVEFSRGGDAAIRSVAQDIALGQQREIGIMSTWLAGWGRPQTSARAPMAWMAGMTDGDGSGGHEHGTPSGTAAGTAGAEQSVRMPGMASEADLARLASASGRDLDVLFLTLMIRHHRGGIEMAQYASLHGADDRVRALARAMVGNQAREIEQMQLDLERLGAPRA
ncbi:hypothetical protein UG55_102464 [Frankia sp. EI5c]|uniref:DUF305 domain-containing protein n=1 Tax=Frankia sp. EI5c TaxID=683316 RepID=UPI0007C31BA3|nr:DUF305 domain-containing protein [Frankia sp. EI5c]OAA25243.1 hypothetical protein UG55_102464 [Frankia sp. EI5c]